MYKNVHVGINGLIYISGQECTQFSIYVYRGKSLKQWDLAQMWLLTRYHLKTWPKTLMSLPSTAAHTQLVSPPPPIALSFLRLCFFSVDTYTCYSSFAAGLPLLPYLIVHPLTTIYATIVLHALYSWETRCTTTHAILNTSGWFCTLQFNNLMILIWVE